MGLFLRSPAIIFSWWLLWAAHDPGGDWAFDFRQFWHGGQDVVNGVSPHPSMALVATAGDNLGPSGIQEMFRFPYPAGAAVVLAPLGALDFELAAVVWSALLIVSLVSALLILGVRDWRVLGVVIGSASVIGVVRLGTLTPVLILLLAVAWRWRDRRCVAGGSLALAISLKLFLWPLASGLWPLVVWLAATRGGRRPRSLAHLPPGRPWRDGQRSASTASPTTPWLIPAHENQGDLWRILLAVTLVGAVAAVSANAPRNRAAI